MLFPYKLVLKIYGTLSNNSVFYLFLDMGDRNSPIKNTKGLALV